MIKMGSFRSYVDLEEYEMKVPPPIDETMLQPNFVNGELAIAEAHQVLKFTSLSKKTGISGSLFVTNARLVFVSSDHVCQDSVPLLSIHTLCHYEDSNKGSSGKSASHRVKLTPNCSQQPSSLFYSGSTRIYELFVICSNFRTLSFSFKFSPIDQGKKICNALLHHAIPDPLERLFYFDYCKKVPDTEGYRTITVPYLDVALDWHKELKITRTPSFRVSEVNNAFQLCETLPEWIVVPASIDDSRLTNLAERLKGSRPPFWVWGDSRGSAIIRMGKLHNEADSTSQDSFFESLRRSHSEKKPPTIKDLDILFPTKEIKLSFNRLLDLCCPESVSAAKELDEKFLSALEHTKWLSWVSKVIQTAGDIADSIAHQVEIVILQEHESRDVSCLLSSTIQIIMDPRFRTAIGFFSLIQKEWIATGHPFHSGYLHTSPVFLLFLDVAYQLCAQNPFQFEFNELLLIEIWDSTFDSTSGTFLFDSPKQRKNLEYRKDLSIWHRILQKETNLENIASYSPKNSPNTFAERKSIIESKVFLFPGPPNLRPSLSNSILPQLPKKLMNPMYKICPLLYPQRPSRDPQHHQYLLACSPCMCDIQLWSSLFLNRANYGTLNLTIGPGISNNNINNSPVLLSEETYHDSSLGNSSSSTTTTTGIGTARTRHYSSNTSSPFEASTSFISQAENSRLSSGADPLTESKLVDILLATLSSTNRYHRHTSGGVSSGSSSSRVLKQTSPGHSSSSSTTSKERKNPFSTHL